MQSGGAAPTLPLETQVAILSTTMDGVLLDLERARMEREDFRQGNAPAPHFVRPPHGSLSWRQTVRALNRAWDDVGREEDDMDRIARDDPQDDEGYDGRYEEGFDGGWEWDEE